MFYDCPYAWSLNIDLIFKEARIKIYLVASPQTDVDGIIIRSKTLSQKPQANQKY